MPSSVGHGLAALAAGWTVSPPPGSRRARLVQAATLIAIGAAPDLDLLIGRHSQETHSIGAALIAGVVGGAIKLPVASSRLRIGLTVALAWATHPLLDMFADDSSAPIGVMALWPFSNDFFHANWTVFSSFYRNYLAPGFITHNVPAIAREILILVPIVLVVWWWRKRALQSKP